ncbi:CaiB/BaiF CoA transferase family protein [Xanthobacter agilis]|uniref:Crotonobetainyl-CoA:carnitine CoA-transferase CaiB-like acyl-CoA transferase n=1 Tax=Xanthobacter agilis TaxID=47492 RepID=A0ABU0LCW1_XANAG|nr:CaiB/BaiF CoA-transferase family protein [Xanthobacter agilis]MDQ0504984.1 crotonobetainyl-CoA:carnitine CoA-transferase CaiB-like acyl-CoA transferase [Xanthobacter agilis]
MSEAVSDRDALDLPLAGVRVLDLSRILAGPWCAMVLGDLGADVVKVEHPVRGDDTRDWGLRTGATNTSYFDSVNRNKRSIGIDLATAEGLALVKALAREADVVVQNFKTGGAEKLGLGYADLSAENPRLIYCSIAGYAPDGAEATRPGYDLVVQGEAGLMALNGEASQPPLKFGVAAVDLFTGQYAAQAVLAALYQRERTGRGRKVELALFDCGLTLTSYYGLEALAEAKDPPRYGNAHPSIVPYGVFRAADGPLVLTVGNNAQFKRFCEAIIDRPDLPADPRFATNLERSRNRAALLPILEAELLKRRRADLLAALKAADIPSGEVLGLLEALSSPRAAETGMVVRRPAETGADRNLLGPPYRLDGHRVPVRRMPPPLAADTAEVLTRELNRSPEEMADLAQRAIVR